MQTLPIFLFNDFNNQSAIDIVYSLLFYADVWREELDSNEAEVKIYINSNGGYCSDLVAMLDTMSSLDIDIGTVCLGKAYSCGAVLFSAGTKGKRLIGKNSKLMIHQVRGGAMGTNEEMKISVDEMNKTNDALAKVLAKNSKLSLKEVKEMMLKDTYLDAKQAVEMGFADKILEDNADEVKSHEAISGKMEFKDKIEDCEYKDYEYGSEDAQKEEFVSKLEIKSIQQDEKNYIIEGFCSVYDEIDYNDDVAKSGFMGKSLSLRGNERPTFWQHGIRDGELPIGKAILTESANGVSFKTELPKNDTLVSGRIMPQIEVGSITDVSFGYVPVKWRNKNGVRELLEVDVFELSLVNIGCNKKAKITGFKSLDNPMKAIREALKEKGYSKSEREDLINSIKPNKTGEQDVDKSGEQMEKAEQELVNMIATVQAMTNIIQTNRGDSDV